MNFANIDRKAMPITLTNRRGRILLKMVCTPIGNEFIVTLSGGDTEHIGAVVVGRTNKSKIHTNGAGSSITDTIVLPKHKEGVIAKSIASLLTTNLNTVVCIICGIHLKNILKTELEDVVEMSQEMTNDLIRQITTR